MKKEQLEVVLYIIDVIIVTTISAVFDILSEAIPISPLRLLLPSNNDLNYQAH